MFEGKWAKRGRRNDDLDAARRPSSTIRFTGKIWPVRLVMWQTRMTRVLSVMFLAKDHRVPTDRFGGVGMLKVLARRRGGRAV